MGAQVDPGQFRPIMRKPLPDLREKAGEIMAIIEANSEPVTETGCWIWTGKIMKGYAIYGIYGKTWKGHRLAYAATKGGADGSLVICHECDVRCCVNPNHLRADTQLANMQEASRRNRWGSVQLQETCKRGHPYGPQRPGRSRQCDICRLERGREQYARRKELGQTRPQFNPSGRNPKAVRYIEYGGERLCVLDWAARFGISGSAMSQRIRKYGDIRAVAMGGRKK